MHKPLIVLIFVCFAIASCTALSFPMPKESVHAASCGSGTPEQLAMEAWLAEGAFPINGVMAGTGSADLQPLKAVLKDVQVVGLGEATRGTAEFFRMKHRLLEFLVTEMDTRIFAMEASYSAGLAVDEYITAGKGDPVTVVRNLGFWTWQTEEVVDMVRWMRTYNQSAPPDRQIRFLGFDVQVVGPGTERLKEYLLSTVGAEADPFLGLLTHVGVENPNRLRRASTVNETHRQLVALAAFLKHERSRLVERSSPEQWQTAVNIANHLIRFHDVYGLAGELNAQRLREQHMAETFLELLEQLGPESRVVLWGHNWHVSTIQPRLGSHLQAEFGDRYYALGFAFLEGSFRAAPRSRQAIKTFTLEPPPGGYREWYLECVLHGPGIVNLRRPIDPRDMVTLWLERPQPTRLIGSLVANDLEAYEPLAAYDGMIYIPKSTASVPLP